MSAALEPITRMRLHQFRRRQQVLEAARGLAVAVVLGLLLLGVVVLVDASLVVNQPVRWCLSLAIYATIAGWIIATVRRVWRRESLPATARAFEQLDPRLREQLLAAVELSEDTPANQASSIRFREIVQQQAAQAIAPVRVGELLPWTLIARVGLAAVVCLAVGVALTLVPGLHWPHRVARALLPGANLGRISRFDVEILVPNPPSMLVPSGDVAAIEARVRGPMPDAVTVETRRAGQSETLAMRGVARLAQPKRLASPSSSVATAIEVMPGDLVYTANLTLGISDVEYRVIAEDAHTPWYRLSTRPRPQATRFRAVITRPAYSGLPEEQMQSTEGDITALKGSRVRLEITTDQPIDKGWLQMNLPEATTPKKIPLTPAGDQAPADHLAAANQSSAPESSNSPTATNTWMAEFAVESDFSYRVHLEAAETHFTNAFSPDYQVRAVVDLSPRLTWESPKSNMLVVEPNQLVPVEVRIEDELPLAEMLLLTSFNGEPAVATQLKAPEQSEGTARLELDLLSLKARVGDTLRAVIQGTDRLGQSAQTAPIELVVSSVAIDPQRRPATDQRIELAGDLRRFSEQVQPQLKRVRDLHEEFNKSHSDSALGELRQAVRQLASQSQSVATELREKVASQLKLPQDSVSLAELERTGQVLGRVEAEISRTAAEAAEELDPERLSAAQDRDSTRDPAVLRRDRANAARSASERIIDSTSVLDRRFREFVAHDVLSEIARGMSVVQDFQRQLASQSDDLPPAQLRRRQAIVARQLRELEQIMIDRSPLLRDAAAHGIRGWIEWAGQMAERVERATAERDDNPNFKEFTKQVLAEVNDHQNVISVDSGLAGEINNGRKELDARSQTAAATLASVAGQIKAVDAARAAGDISETEAADQWREQLAAGLDHLQNRKQLQQARGDSDAFLVNDLGNAIRGSRQLLDNPDETPDAAAQQLTATASALKKLEAIHNVAEANKHLADLEQTERWTASSVEARTESPRAWDALLQRLEQSARALRDAGIDAGLAAELDRLRLDRAAAEAGQKISARRWSADAHASAETELSELREQFDSTRAKLAQVAEAVRSELGALAPSVPELAHRAAEKTQELEQRTAQLSKSAAADEVPDLKSRLDQLTADQAETVQPINDLRDALTELAATQDLLQQPQREVARDADTSQHIIDKANEQITDSLKPATAAETPAAAAAPLEKAAAAQAQATEALEQIADHFEKLQAGDLNAGELADSRQALKQLASDLDMKEMEEWYKTAETLGKLAGGDPQQVLKRLEDELARNARMREELSDISKQAVSEAVESLNFSVGQEHTLQSQLEQSDPAFAVKKALLQQDIQAANERLQQWMQQLTSDASSVAGRAGAREQQKQLGQLQQQLQSVVAAAGAARDSLPLEELQSIARGIVENLQGSQQQLNAVAESLQASANASVHANEQELRNRKREMEDWQRRNSQQQSRGAQAIERSHEQRYRQADNATRNAESLLRTAERQRDELAKRAKQQPDSDAVKRQLADAETKVRLQETELKIAKEKQTELKQRLDRAKENVADMAARKPGELKEQNPTAELASRFADAAAKTADMIAQELARTLADADWMTELKVGQEQLNAGSQTQQRVETSVADVAEDLQRAARHEQRLEHPKAAEQIEQQAARVATAGQSEVHAGTERLIAAAEQARAAAAADQAANASPVASLAARQAISEAEVELRERAGQLKALTEQRPVEEARPAGAEPAMPPVAPPVPLDPKMLARMLDELDRAMSDAGEKSEDANQAPPSQSSEAGKSEDENNQNSGQQSSPGGKQSAAQMASMQEAARQLAEQMNRQRAQGRQSTAASRMSSNSADTKAAPPSAVRVLDVDRRSGEDWGKLREQSAEETVDSARQTVAPQYRQSVETYFRVLSERGHRSGQP